MDSLRQLKEQLEAGETFFYVDCPCCDEEVSVTIDPSSIAFRCGCGSTKADILKAWGLPTVHHRDDLKNEIELKLRSETGNTLVPPPTADELIESVESDYKDISTKEGQTDNSAATRFVDENENKIRRVGKWKKFIVWDGKRWFEDDESAKVQALARKHAKSYWQDLVRIARIVTGDELRTVQTFCKRANDARGIDAVVKLSASDSRVAISHEELNKNPILLNVKNGTFNLETGVLGPHNPADLITQIAAVEYDQSATCPKWQAFLELVFDSDDELIRYVQKICGIACSGLSNVAILPIAYGPGGNGKSVFWNVALKLLGDYGHTAPETLLTGLKNEHPTVLAALHGKRFVTIAEPDKDVPLKESRVKALTGNDRVAARGMNENWWDFEPTHTFFMSTNHLPKVMGTDEGIWRRLKPIPFKVRIKDKVKPDEHFAEKLLADEAPGILNWMLSGFRLWRDEGLDDPQKVSIETAKYRNQEDAYREFIEDCCEVGPGMIVTLLM